MFNQPANAWIPFKIPRTPPTQAPEKWALMAKDGADPAKNPSAFLEWKETVRDGEEVDDMLRWDGERWVNFPAEGSAEDPYFLKYNGSQLSWGPAALPEGTNEGDLLYWNPSAGDGGAWVILSAPSNSNILIKEFNICENGQPKKYKMLVWDQN